MTGCSSTAHIAPAPSSHQTTRSESLWLLLDELPLAIELAAARTNMLSVATILERLDTALDVLSTRYDDVEHRQRTLTATIAWSYDLLDSEEQYVFRALSVFSGGFGSDPARRCRGCQLRSPRACSTRVSFDTVATTQAQTVTGCSRPSVSTRPSD